MKKVSSIKKETTLCLCLNCKEAFVVEMSMQDKPPKCKACNSSRTLIDQLFEIPINDVVFVCKCGNKHYKICKRPDESIYWMCVACGQRSTD